MRMTIQCSGAPDGDHSNNGTEDHPLPLSEVSLHTQYHLSLITQHLLY